MQPTTFCWKCGHPIYNKNGELSTTELFCSQKHKEQFEREQDSQIRKGKKAGYGLAGSCH